MRQFQVMALTPSRFADPAIAIAASRAGYWGILDLEYSVDAARARSSIDKLIHFTTERRGLKLGSTSAGLGLLADLPDSFDTIILTPANADILQKQMRLLRDRNADVLFEVTSLAEARLGMTLGVHGLIAKGHEAGGRVGEETAFVLLQLLLKRQALPVWVQGGISLHTAAACYVAQAAGVVLDAQLALTRESSLPDHVKARIARMDGSETVCIGAEWGTAVRMYSQPGLPNLDDVTAEMSDLVTRNEPASTIHERWRQTISARANWEQSDRAFWLIGQDAAFAKPLADQYQTVAGVLQAIHEALAQHVETAAAYQPLAEHSALAQAHRTRYPIVQGPMTRVSDNAQFAAHVADAGGLPFLALALMHEPDARKLLEETREALSERAWGVGILGFVSPELRQEQLKVIHDAKPPFALIAGGRPDQAQALEQAGITVYLHVPSPALLKIFVESGARHFVFEGRECGGHVGPRTSFVLWNIMIDVLMEALPAGETCHVLFAGGIHDGRSAAMVAALAAPLVERGIKIGVLMGTSYLFTEEAVASDAIVEGFQQVALDCDGTALLETGPGHATRCAATTYVGRFQAEKLRLSASGSKPEAMRETLEELNLGRLRIASKGISRHPEYPENPNAPKFVTLTPEEQHEQGMYMIGQVAALHEATCTVAELHHDVSSGATQLVAEQVAAEKRTRKTKSPEERPSDVAIIGIGALLPGAPNVQTYWENILNKVDCITEVPPERWDWHDYYDPDPNTHDKVYSKWGGFLDDVPFNPMAFGIPPSAIPSIEPLQLLMLDVVRQALDDAGYSTRPFPRERTSVILGLGGGMADLGQQYAIRSGLPMYIDGETNALYEKLPEWSEDSFAGILLNVVAGRVANRFNLGGVNYAVDAACASSLAAIYLATRELESGASDMVIVGGGDTVQNPFGYLCFSKTRALSPKGRCQTFDDQTDGIVISEGLAILVLKRLADAERDGDRIYAVIKSAAGSSDGRAKGLTAPSPAGQVRVLERAYAKAQVSPATVGLVEAHGTGTVAGDRAEIEALSQVFSAADAKTQGCAIGSVKSMIGHTKCTAGVAGTIKVALSLYHKVLPPTLHVTQPNKRAKFDESAFYVSSELRPWLRHDGRPRRAGVSAFGFGGTNFHLVLEEYTRDYARLGERSLAQALPSELLLWRGNSRKDIVSQLDMLQRALAQGAKPSLRDLAYSVWKSQTPDAGLRLAMVASSLDEFAGKLTQAIRLLSDADKAMISDPNGIYFTESPLIGGESGQVAFLFPGQGSQSPNMLADLVLHFAEMREHLEQADAVLADRLPELLSSYIFPIPTFTPEEQRAQQDAITQTRIAQPALGVVDLALLDVYGQFNVTAAMAAGHSYGEYVALYSASTIDEPTLYRLSEARGYCISEYTANEDAGTMAAVMANLDTVKVELENLPDVWIANINAPEQIVISGTKPGIERALAHFADRGMHARPIPVACAFHSPVIAPAQDHFAKVLATIDFQPPHLPVYSNTYARPYSENRGEIAGTLSEHLTRPVRFTDQIAAMYAAGARIFVEVGPGRVLTGLTRQILGDQQYLALASDVKGRNGVVQLQHVLAQLAVQGVAVKLDRLYEGRDAKRLDLSRLVETSTPAPLPATTWLVNGGRAKPLNAPEKVKRKVVHIGESGMGQQPADNGKSPDMCIPVTNGKMPQVAIADGAESDTVMTRFQQMMRHFLDTQQQVMLAYLNQPTETTVMDVSRATDAGSISSAEVPEITVPMVEESEQHYENEATTNQPAQADDWLEVLLGIVEERTGYPREMLDIDLNMEADLGIDSIKRVEILSAFQRARLQGVPDLIERLNGAKSLRAIVTVAEAVLGQNGHGESAVQQPQPMPALPQEQAVQNTPRRAIRYLPTLQAMSLSGADFPIEAGSVVVITDDERGIAAAVAEALRIRGARSVLIQMGDSDITASERVYRANLSDPEAVATVVRSIQVEHGAINSIVHLLGLGLNDGSEQTTIAQWREYNRKAVKSFFYLTRTASDDLQASGTGRVVAVTALGGAFCSDGLFDERLAVGQAGLLGFTKCLAREWSNVHCKVVDVNPLDPGDVIVNNLLGELVTRDDEVEVGYRDQQRLVPRVRSAPLTNIETTQLAIDSNSIILITGGARGITAEIAQELASQYQPTLLLIGRSPVPLPVEDDEMAYLSDPKALKARLVEQMKQQGQSPVIAQVESAYQQLMKDREIRKNIAQMKQAGSRVYYYPVDVADADAFSRLIDALYSTWGRIDGVIHGAGMIDDKLVKDKTTDSFDRVFDTKADSAFVLGRALRPESLRFLVFFGSVAGRFGNAGQSDYAAANEVLNKLAIALDRRWDTLVKVMNWGPWGQVGMVTAEVGEQFAKRGVRLVSPDEGRRSQLQELISSRKGEVEIIIGDGPWAAASESPHPYSGVLLHGCTVASSEDSIIEIVRPLDLTRDPYLTDHRLDGHPVLPAAVALELIAEAARTQYPDLEITDVQDFQLLKGVVLKDDPISLRITSRPLPDTTGNGQTALALTIDDLESHQPYYRAGIMLRDHLPVQQVHLERLLDGDAFAMDVATAYQQWLFQGPLFQGIQTINSISRQGMSAVLMPSTPSRFTASQTSDTWLFDPVVVDSAFQMAILWIRAMEDLMPLPARFQRFSRYAPFNSPEIHCDMRATTRAGGHLLETHFVFRGANDRILGVLEGMEFSCSRDLNRLAGKPLQEGAE